MPTRVIFLTGWSASGKSTIARELQKKLGCNFLGTREVIHELALKMGFKRIRAWLRSCGTKEVVKMSRAAMVEAIGGLNSSQDLIIDDAFDSKLPSAVKRTYSQADILVLHINATKAHRLERMAKRLSVDEKGAVKESRLIDGFKKEAGIEQLISTADFKIDNNGELQRSVNQAYSILDNAIKRSRW